MQNKQVQISDLIVLVPDTNLLDNLQILNHFQLDYQHSFYKSTVSTESKYFPIFQFNYDPQAVQISIEVYTLLGATNIRIKILDIAIQSFQSLNTSPLVPVFSGVQAPISLTFDEYKSLYLFASLPNLQLQATKLDHILQSSEFKALESKVPFIKEAYNSYLINTVKCHFQISITPNFNVNQPYLIKTLLDASKKYSTTEFLENGIICIFQSQNSNKTIQLQLVDDPENRQFSLETQIKPFEDSLQVLNLLPANQAPLRSSVQSQIASLQLKSTNSENKRFLYCDVFEGISLLSSGSVPVAQVLFQLIQSFKTQSIVNLRINLQNGEYIELKCVGCGFIEEYYKKLQKVEDKVFQEELKKEQQIAITKKPELPIKVDQPLKRTPEQKSKTPNSGSSLLVQKPQSNLQKPKVTPQKAILVGRKISNDNNVVKNVLKQSQSPKLIKSPQYPIQAKKKEIDITQCIQKYSVQVCDCLTQNEKITRSGLYDQEYQTKIYKYLDIMTVNEAKNPSFKDKDFQSREVDATHGAFLGKIVSSAYERVMNRYK